MRITSGMIQRRVMADLNNVSERLTNTQTKIASNKELTRPSDDPFAVARALSLRQDLGGIHRYQSTAEDALGWQEATETSLSRMSDAVQRARELTIHGGSDTSDSTARQALATEIDALIGGVKENANATYRGQYLFAGTETSTPPYDLANEPPRVPDDGYQGNGGAVAREIGPGVSIQVNLTGADLLGSGGDGKLLHVLRDIAQHLRDGNATELRGNDLKKLDASLNGLLDSRALNGARANRVEAATTRLGQLEETTITQLSETEDADIAKQLIDFSSQQAAYQSALKAGANIIQSSLMDFLR